jgi:hypothetical protein
VDRRAFLRSLAALGVAVPAAALRRYLASSRQGQSIRRLRANETTVPEGRFKQQRERYYTGLRRAGLPD